MFLALKKSGKYSLLAFETLNFEFPIDMFKVYGLLVEAYVVCHKSNMKQFYFSKQ